MNKTKKRARIISHQELREFKERYELTGAKISSITGTNPRTVRRWLDPKTSDTIPWATWQWMRAVLATSDQLRKIRKAKELRSLLRSGGIGPEEYWSRLEETLTEGEEEYGSKAHQTR